METAQKHNSQFDGYASSTVSSTVPRLSLLPQVRQAQFSPVAVSVAEKITALEEKAKELECLCGNVIATVRVNYDRKTLTSVDDKTFGDLLAGWVTRFRAVTQKEAPCAWCRGPEELPQGDGSLVSHGICPTCKAKQLAKLDMDFPATTAGGVA